MKLPFFRVGDIVTLKNESTCSKAVISAILEYSDNPNRGFKVLIDKYSSHVYEGHFNEFKEIEFPDNWYCKKTPDALSLLKGFFLGTPLARRVIEEIGEYGNTDVLDCVGFYGNYFQIHEEKIFLEHEKIFLTYDSVLELLAKYRPISLGNIMKQPEPMKSENSLDSSFGKLSVMRKPIKFF